MSCLILHNIRSNFNVGSAFRTADAAGIAHIYLTGYTPLPVDRFGRGNKELAKVALGAEKSIPWTHEADGAALIEKLKKEKNHIVAVEQDPRAVDYKKFAEQVGGWQIEDRKNICLIFGNEVDGVELGVLDLADTIIEIPMRGEKESLNVSVAMGIVLFRLFDRGN